MPKVVPSFDEHENLGYGTIKAVEERAGSWYIQVATSVLTLPSPYNGAVWAAGERPTHGNAEIVRVKESIAITGGRELKIERKQEGSLERTIKVGDQFMNAVTVKAFTDIQNAVTAEPHVSGTTFVTTEGSSQNDGSSWAKAKPGTAAGVMEAVNALPLGPEGGRIGKVEIGASVIETNSTGRFVTGCSFKAGSKPPVIEVPGLTNADLGAYLVGQEYSGVEEGNHIAEVLEGTWNAGTGKVEVGGTNKFAVCWGGKINEKEANKEGSVGSPAFTGLFIVKPAIELPTGVSLIGRGRMSGYQGEGATDYATVLEDQGTGITIQIESGVGEKEFETLGGGGVIRDLAIVGNPNTLFGVAVACNFGTKLHRVSVIGHGYWGARIGQQATVVLSWEDVEFRQNGMHGVSPTDGPKSLRPWQEKTGPQEYGKHEILNETEAEVSKTTTLKQIQNFSGIETGTQVTGAGIPAATTIVSTPTEAEILAGEAKLSQAGTTETKALSAITFKTAAKYKPQYNIGDRVYLASTSSIYEALTAGKEHKPDTTEGVNWKKVPYPAMRSGGVCFAKSPNTGFLYNIRAVGNYGIGVEGWGISIYGGACSKTATVAGVVGGEGTNKIFGGVALRGEGHTASGSFACYSVWFENSEKWAVEGTGAFYSCQFQGHSGVEEYAIKTSGASVPLTAIDCQFFGHSSKVAIKMASSSAWLVMTPNTAGAEKDVYVLETQSKEKKTFSEIFLHS